MLKVQCEDKEQSGVVIYDIYLVCYLISIIFSPPWGNNVFTLVILTYTWKHAMNALPLHNTLTRKGLGAYLKGTLAVPLCSLFHTGFEPAPHCLGANSSWTELLPPGIQPCRVTTGVQGRALKTVVLFSLPDSPKQWPTLFLCLHSTIWYELHAREWPYKSQPAEVIIWQIGNGMKPNLAQTGMGKEISVSTSFIMVSGGLLHIFLV